LNQPTWFSTSFTIEQIVISTEAARVLCELRSGETRFSTSTISSPPPTFARPVQLATTGKLLLLLPLLLLIFYLPSFRPKIACQAPKQSNPLQNNNICVAF
jgi:hypothetical protein